MRDGMRQSEQLANAGWIHEASILFGHVFLLRHAVHPASRLQPIGERRPSRHDDGNRNDGSRGSRRLVGHGSRHDDHDDGRHGNGRRFHLQRARLDEAMLAMGELPRLLVAIVLMLRRQQLQRRLPNLRRRQLPLRGLSQRLHRRRTSHDRALRLRAVTVC